MPKANIPTLWTLRGTFKGKSYECASFDISYLQSLQTKIFRNDGHGLIVKSS
jgi:hypothetical protein